MLLGVFRPRFGLPVGDQFIGTASVPAVLAAIILVMFPLAFAWYAWRGRVLFETGVAAACAIASVVGWWSALNVREQIGDYHFFWVSAVGALDVACALTIVEARSGRGVRRWRLPTPSEAGLALALGAVLLAVPSFVRSTSSYTPRNQEEVISRIVPPLLANFPQTGNQHPLVRIEADMEALSRGTMLQLVKAHVDFTIDDPDMLLLYGQHRKATGREDSLVDIVRLDLHADLMKRPGNVVLAEDADAGIYIDEVSLIDFPAYRPR
jgi:hypothetical protein